MTAATDNAPWRPVDSLANRLRLVRAEKGLSQKEAAFACGISPRVWQNAEDGRSIRDEVQVLASIAKHLDVDREWLFWGGALNSENPHPDGPDGGENGTGSTPQDPNADKRSCSISRVATLALVS